MRSLRYIGTVLMLLIAFLQGANAREESVVSNSVLSNDTILSLVF